MTKHVNTQEQCIKKRFNMCVIMFGIYKLCTACDTQIHLETISFTKLHFSIDLHRNECDHFVFTFVFNFYLSIVFPL